MRIVLHQDEIVGRWVCRMTGGEYSGGVAIGMADDVKLIAGVLYDTYNGASIAMHVAGHARSWMTREYLWMCFHYPFEQLKVKKVIGLVSENNGQARRFDEHLGFVLETRIKDAHPDGDLLIYSMTRQQCRFLELKRHGRKILTTSGA